MHIVCFSQTKNMHILSFANFLMDFFDTFKVNLHSFSLVLV